jgi:hypothetical protein
MVMKNQMAFPVPILLLSSACTVAPSVDQSAADQGSAQQPEKWSTADDPALFTRDLERNIQELPSQGEASPIPWAGSYWPTYKDTINYRWDGPRSRSPAEKYEEAFGGSRVEDRLSQYYGVDSQTNAKSCTTDQQCDKSLHEVCGKREWARTGRCIPTWFGICHGWAPAAILLPEPKHEVVENGVVFKVQDIKALLSLMYASATMKFVSLRCEANDSHDGSAANDAYGRPAAPDCRDTNPGTYHIILTNYLGIQKKSFVEDRTFDYQVWNFPLRGYKILEEREISAKEANSLIVTGSAPDRYLFNDDAKSFVYVKNDVSYISVASAERDGSLSGNIDSFTGHDVYEYILELDGTGKIIGGEWVGSSKRNHPDFIWLPTGPASTTVAGGAIRYNRVKRLANASVAP